MARVLLVLCGTAILLVPAFINGYPLVYSDTGTYLSSALTGYVPYDRPYWYGPFVLATSVGGISLWGVAVAQALLCTAYVHRICDLICDGRMARRWFFIACVVLSAGSSAGWYAARLIPDIFTGIGLLAVYSLMHARGSFAQRSLDVLVIVAACWFHSSNLLILPLAGTALLVLRRKVHRGMQGAALARSVLVTVLGFGGLALANRALDGEAYITRNSHVFFMGRMLDTGMLKPYLDEHCGTERSGICAYKDSLPANSQAFLWSDKSPLNRQGGWDATKEEYSRIVRGSFTEPRYLWWHVRGSISSTLDQLCAWEICHAMESQWYRTESSPPYMVIKAQLPHEFQRYMGSLQNGGRGELNMDVPDLLYRLVLGASLIGIAWAWWRRRGASEASEAMLFARYALAAVIIGAWVCASLSVVDTRYLSRDSWLLPLAAMLLVAEDRWKRKAPAA